MVQSRRHLLGAVLDAKQRSAGVAQWSRGFGTKGDTASPDVGVVGGCARELGEGVRARGRRLRRVACERLDAVGGARSDRPERARRLPKRRFGAISPRCSAPTSSTRTCSRCTTRRGSTTRNVGRGRRGRAARRRGSSVRVGDVERGRRREWGCTSPGRRRSRVRARGRGGGRGERAAREVIEALAAKDEL